ncbi:MAG: TraM recognition domain-containing protein [Actinomycetota bacterium]|nr:TraM recognition domain-containing protein [Actinomycetota bacterium]
MSSTQTRRGTGSGAETIALGVFITFMVVALGTTWTATHLAANIDRAPAPPANPFTVLFGVFGGTVPWTPTATKVAAGAAVGFGILAALIGSVVLKVVRRSVRVDKASPHMARGRDLGALRKRAATATADRLGVEAGPGMAFATTLSGQTLYRSWEDVMTVIAGPRVGKTSSFVIPEILDAPGAVLTTSNKRDVVDATRGVRSVAGQVWIFDPQGLVAEPLTWWWNPLTYVTDEVKARQLADMFEAASHEPDAKVDPYFNPKGRDLLANLLLAAALDGRPLTQVYLWLSNAVDDTPAVILEHTGYNLVAASVRSVSAAAPEERSGIYGNASQMASFMLNRQAMSWVEPPTGPPVPQFDPHTFVRTRDTLYSLSKEGQGSAGGLIAALAAAVCEAAEDLAKTEPGGHLVTPMLVVLDEAANVCRWGELPNLYSHYGSRGILISTYLQSWSQGAEVWGRNGMAKLWSASNIKIYAGGVDENDFLSNLSKSIGNFSHTAPSVTNSRSGRSVSRQERIDVILDIADLRSLPRGRAVVLASGTRAALVRTLPWMDGPHAKAVKDSIAGTLTGGATP